ncbi:MAG: response regulator [Candidatus Riflebacteria bacterium]|nr:response regulator [Candidatus Riflebacteria bacterium]
MIADEVADPKTPDGGGVTSSGSDLESRLDEARSILEAVRKDRPGAAPRRRETTLQRLREVEETLSLAQQWYENLYALADDGILVHELTGEDSPGAFVQSNPAICRLLGYTRAQMLRLTPVAITAPEDRASVPGDTQAVRRGAVLRHEKTLVGSDGRRIPVEIVCRRFSRDGRLLALSVIRDVTARRQVEQRLRELDQALRMRLAERAAEAPGRAEQPPAPAPPPVGGPPETHRGAAGGGSHRRGEPTRVLVVDDHRIVREGLARLLELEPGIEVVGQAPDGQRAIELAGTVSPDVIVMDVNLGEMSGVEATRRILALNRRARIIGLSMHVDRHVATAMFDAGAIAYLTKNGPPEDLIAAIRACLKG